MVTVLRLPAPVMAVWHAVSANVFDDPASVASASFFMFLHFFTPKYDDTTTPASAATDTATTWKSGLPGS